MSNWKWFVIILLALICIAIIIKGADFPPIEAGSRLAIRDAQVKLLSLQLQYANLPTQIQQAQQAYAKLINDTKPKECTSCSFDEQQLEWVK